MRPRRLAAACLILTLAAPLCADDFQCAGSVNLARRSSVESGINRANRELRDAGQKRDDAKREVKDGQRGQSRLRRKNSEIRETISRIRADQPGSPEIDNLEDLYTENQEALDRLDQQVAEAERKLPGLESRVDRCESEIQILEGALETAEATPPRLTSFKGKVEACRQESGKMVCRDASEGIELKEGESIRTGKDGRAELLYDDGSKIWMKENTVFTVRQMEGNLLVEGKLALGKLRAMFNRLTCENRASGCSIRTPVAVAAVRGTEFDFRIDDAKNTHLTPHDGTVELSAVAGKIDRSKLKRWWTGKLSGEEPEELLHGVLAMVVSVQGKVGRKNADGDWQHAEEGMELSKGDRLETGTGAYAELILQGGYIALVGPRSRFETRTDEYEEKGIYGLWRGKIYVVRDDESELDDAAKPAFITPAVHCAVSGGKSEFEYSVAESKLVDYMAYRGAIEITADKERIEWDKVDHWWE